jgi:hypothetical protein
VQTPRELCDDAVVNVRPAQNWYGHWLLPMALLAAVAMVVFATAYLLDHLLAGGHPSSGALSRYTRFDSDLIADAIAQLAPVVIGMFGIVVTVVRMFLRDRVNRLAMGYYVVIGVCGLWLSFGLQADFVPRAALLLTLSAASVGLLLMLPYFGYVFRFLEPVNLVQRIGREASTAVAAGTGAARLEQIDARQAAALSALAELTDIVSNSISGNDKIIASRAVNAYRDFVSDYLALKPRAVDGWFRIGTLIRTNPDFVAMDPESLVDLEQRRTWVEWQVLRQYLGIYNEALVSMRDINYLVAIDTRYIGEAASQRDDRELVALVLRYFNSYLRSTLNARDVRTAYNVLNQYRLLAETLMRQRNGAYALEAARHMGYYGQVSFDMSLTFVSETVAYDLASLCQLAHQIDAPEQEALLGHFLELDRPLRNESQERALLGVRKAQTKLAAYYLSVGDDAHALCIARDMMVEPDQRLAVIRNELERVRGKDFWEIIDRGRNFEYMPPAQRAQLDAFFQLLEQARLPDPVTGQA